MLLHLLAAAGLVVASPLQTPRLSTRQAVRGTNAYSGVALTSSPDGTAMNYITAQINVPDTIFVNAEGNPGQLQKAAAWVGFGGRDASQNPGGSVGILQTGCVFLNDGQQDKYTRCWVEFFPDPPQFFDGFSPSIGDTMKLELTRTSDTTGHAVITNLNTGENVASDITAPSGTTSSGQDADWVVEDPSGQNNFVNFQKEFFEACSVATDGGNYYGPGDQPNLVWNLYKDLGNGAGKSQWAGASAPSETEVEVDWTSSYS